jgi:uncharacterized membrane protein HdeD (DUF308 family)
MPGWAQGPMAVGPAVCCTSAVKSPGVFTATMKSSDLAGKLWRVSLLRGVVALGMGVYVLSRPISSPAALAWVVSAYWIFDGLVALWASRFAASLETNRTLLLVRGAVGIVAAVVLFRLPLGEIFGPWQPGQIMLFIFSMVPALTALALQIIMAATIDLLIGLEVRRRIAGEWSVVLGAAVSILLSGLVAVGFLGFSAAVPGRLLAVVALAGGLGLVAGAFRLRAFHN